FCCIAKCRPLPSLRECQGPVVPAEIPGLGHQRETPCGENRRNDSLLVVSYLDCDDAAGLEMAPCPGCDRPVAIRAVRSAVECGSGIMVPDFDRQRFDI